MPRAPKRPCLKPGCRELVDRGYCARHQAERERRYESARPSAAKRGYGRRWRRLREWFLSRNPICVTPGCGRPATDVDHIVPRGRGGSDDPSNLQALCRACHSRKTAREDGRWRAVAGGAMKEG